MAWPKTEGAGFAFSVWLHQHKRWLSMVGAAIAITAFVSKEIL